MIPLWSNARTVARVAWPGAAVGSVLAVLALVADTAPSMLTGFGTVADVAIALGLSIVALGVLGLVVGGVRRLLNAWPPALWVALAASFVLAYAVLAAVDAGDRVGVVVAGATVLVGAALGGAVTLVGRRPSRATWLLFAIVAGGFAALAAWVWIPGTDPYVARVPRPPSAVAPLSAEDPSARGRYPVRSLTYGSGTDRRRPEYRDGVVFRSMPVDGSWLLPALTGFKAKARRWYWGFGADALPLNARVWYPEGGGPFPLVVIVHGNHRMEDASDQGYAYLAETLASHGFISVSIDQNFLNYSWSGDVKGDMTARAWLLLEHLAAWRRWNETEGHPFHRRVDMERIALVGHSRGGEAVAHAAAVNRLPCLPRDCTRPLAFRFPIRAVVALAPVDGDQSLGRPVPIEGVSYLTVHGSHDGDVPTFEGLRPFTRARLGDGPDRFKAAVYVYRANHSQFNSRWGDDDVGRPFERFTLRRSLLTGEEQRRVTQVLVGGFLEAALNGRGEYRTMFRDARRAAGWLPPTSFFTQFEDTSFRTVADFTGIDPTRGTLDSSTLAGEHLTTWRQADVQARTPGPSRVRAVHLGWRQGAGSETARYRIMLPDAALGLDSTSRLVLTAADAGGSAGPVDFTIELVTSDGVASRQPLSRIAALPPMPRVRFTKWRLLDRAFYQRESEPAFQTSELPLALFAAPGWRAERVREVRLVFDRTPAGLIALRAVGWSRPAAGEE